MRLKRLASAVGAASLMVTAAPRVSASPVDVLRRCFGELATIVGTPGPDRIEGTPGRDVISGLGGADTILGRDGGDRLCGGAGHDRLVGGGGRDLLAGQRGGDRAGGGPNDDHLDGGAGRDRLVGGDGRRNDDTLAGRAGADELHGGDGRFDEDYLFGGRGRDALDGGDGSASRDRVFGGSGNDVLRGGAGGDDIASFLFSNAPTMVDLATSAASGEGDDALVGIESLQGSLLSDSLSGDGGANGFDGFHGNDVISGADGPDTLDGGLGDDSLGGGAGSDTASFTWSPSGVRADLEASEATGGGTDSLLGFESLFGSAYDDSLSGTAAPNSLDGWYGTNTLFGLDGDDTLERGGGDAGAGEDTCYSSGADNCEVIVIVDPISTPEITTPRQASTLPRERFQRVAGTIAAGLGPEPSGTVDVALRRLTARGCRWWSASARSLVVRPCGSPLWNEVAMVEGAWSMPVTRTLPPGIYDARASFPGKPFTRGCSGYFGPPCIDFFLE